MKEVEMIIGVIGTIASGKDSVANYFVKKYKFKKIIMSNFLREVAEDRGLSVKRENLYRVQSNLRKTYGEEVLINMAITKIIEENWKNVVISGLRTVTDVSIARKKLKAKIILVDANPELRFKRQRKRRRTGFSENYEEFLHGEAIENASFDFHKTKKLAHFKIDNDQEYPQLHKKCEAIAKKLKL
ncbi:MAG: AAA family ATPase [archaeon]